MRILFVDDEPEILAGLKRMLRGKRKEWRMTFLESGPAALELLKEENFEVIVSDMRMPVMDGAELLDNVRRLYPNMARIILSGHSEQINIMRSVKPAHQYLSKPVDQDELETVLARALSLYEILGDENLARIVSQTENLPSLPEVYDKLLKAIDSEQSSLASVGEIISKDMGMTATILKVVNSSFFGIARRISQPEQAVGLLGLEIVKSLVLSHELFSAFDSARLRGFSFEGLWRHSLATAAMAKIIASEEGLDSNQVDEAYLAGLVHDVGKLVLAMGVKDEYEHILREVKNSNRLIWEVEMEVLGTTHAEAGAYLMGLWGVNDDVMRVIAYHHQPSLWQGPGFAILGAVHAANVFEHQLYVINEHYARPQWDQEYLKAMGLEKRVTHWQEACRRFLGKDKNHAPD